MKKTRCIVIILSIFLLSCTLIGCESAYIKNEEKIYQETVEEFFEALEKEDAKKIKSLFADSVIESDTDIDEQIEKLISVYPKSKTTIINSSLPCMSMSESDELGRTVYTPDADVAVMCDGKYYWCFIEMIYREGRPLSSAAINRVYLYTADEYYLYFRGEDVKQPTEIGVLVFAEQELDFDIECISSIPYEFIETDTEIEVSKVKEFLKSNNSFEDFVKTFGEPNATNKVSDHYYTIPQTKELSRYLSVQTQDGKIHRVNIVDRSGFYFDLVWEEE